MRAKAACKIFDDRNNPGFSQNQTTAQLFDDESCQRNSGERVAQAIDLSCRFDPRTSIASGPRLGPELVCKTGIDIGHASG